MFLNIDLGCHSHIMFPVVDNNVDVQMKLYNIILRYDD